MKTPAKGAGYKELIANREFIVVDLETTTRDSDTGPTQTLPASIGCVLWRNGRTRDTRHWLLNPGVPIDAASSAYNGLTDADLAGQPDEATVIAQFDAFLAAHPDAEQVCHNAHFDIVRLHEAYDRTGRTRFTRINAWTAQVAECVDLRCPYASEKVTIETAHAAPLVPELSALLSGTARPRQIGTLLGALEPLLTGLDRAQARAWYKPTTRPSGTPPPAPRPNPAPPASTAGHARKTSSTSCSPDVRWTTAASAGSPSRSRRICTTAPAPARSTPGHGRAWPTWPPT